MLYIPLVAGYMTAKALYMGPLIFWTQVAKSMQVK